MKLKTNGVVLASMLLLSTAASAATVIFTGVDYTDSLISTRGDLIGALNATTAVTVNGVPFAAASPNAGALSLSGNVAVIHTGGVGQSSGSNGAPGDLTNGGIFHVAGTDGSLIFDGLTPGQEYEIQMVFSDIRGTLTPDTMRIWGNETGAGPADFTTADIMTAQLVTGTFEADSTTQGFYLTQDTLVGSFDGYLGAFQLRAIPEPSSVVLFGTSALVLLLRRRK